MENFHLKNVIGEGTKKAPLSNASQDTSILLGHIYGNGFVIVRALCCDIESTIMAPRLTTRRLQNGWEALGRPRRRSSSIVHQAMDGMLLTFIVFVMKCDCDGCEVQ